MFSSRRFTSHWACSRIRSFRRVVKNETPETLVNSSILCVYRSKIDFVFPCVCIGNVPYIHLSIKQRYNVRHAMSINIGQIFVPLPSPPP